MAKKIRTTTTEKLALNQDEKALIGLLTSWSKDERKAILDFATGVLGAEAMYNRRLVHVLPKLAPIALRGVAGRGMR
jgi:hypothetical protein